MQVQPYLFFNGRCEEAAAFYKKALGAEVTALMRFKDNPDPPAAGCDAPGYPAGAAADKVMHMSMRIGEATILASDGMNSGPPKFEGFSLALSVADDAEAKRRFEALSDGGEVRMPLAKTFFSSSFGVVADRFGVPWMIVVE